MKAVLMAFHQKWCEKIFRGEKTIEVRKVAPKLKTPYKVYAYQTKNRGGAKIINDCLDSVYGGGKVVGEFVCDKTIELPCETTQPHWLKDKTCLSDDEYMDYLGHKDGKGLYIAKPKRYDRPKELEVFWSVRCTNKTGDCENCEVKPACINNITRPPQSWCYVEEIEE